ncbi:hypothetical protein, partial [Hymenobacter agri]
MLTPLRAASAGFGALLLLAPALTHAQTAPPPPTERVLVVHPAVGPEIDAAEKARFGLFPNYAADDFQAARFVRSLTPDSAITLKTTLRNGRQLTRPYLPEEFAAVHDVIEQRQRELATAPPPPPPP